MNATFRAARALARPLSAAVFTVAVASITYEATAQTEKTPETEAVEEVVVQATRFGRRVEDEAIRVEVISQEEIEEKLLMRPGNIATLLSETGGLRVQVTSPALGSSNIRVQGIRRALSKRT